MPVLPPVQLFKLSVPWCTRIPASLHSAVLAMVLVLGLGACSGSSGGGGEPGSTDTDSGIGNVSGAPDTGTGLPDASQCNETIESVRINAPVALVNSASPCDYYLKGSITLSSAVTIEPGTVFLAALGTSVFLDSGQLTAVGTADAPIVFRGETALPGFWSGISMASLRPSRLEHVEIHDAGDNSPGNGTAGLRISRSTIGITDVTVSNSYVHGASITSTTQLTAFARNRFVGNALSGLIIPAHLIERLDTASDYRGIDNENGDPVVTLGVDFNDLVDTTWPAINAPYRITYLAIGQNEKLTLAPGARLAMDTDATLNVLNDGQLVAEGTNDKPIEIAAAPGATGRWDTLQINGGHLRLQHARITGAQNGITLDHRGTLSVAATAFADYRGAGILCESRFSSTAEYDADKLSIGNDVSFDGSGSTMLSARCPGSQ